MSHLIANSIYLVDWRTVLSTEALENLQTTGRNYVWLLALFVACVFRFVGTAVVTHGGMWTWHSLQPSVNPSGLMQKIHFSCSIRGSY